MKNLYDSSIYVVDDCVKDYFMYVDLDKNYCTNHSWNKQEPRYYTCEINFWYFNENFKCKTSQDNCLSILIYNIEIKFLHFISKNMK